MFEYFMNLIYPRKCGFCMKICKEYICKRCEKKLEQLYLDKVINVSKRNFQKQAYLFKYEGIIRKRLLEYKFFYKGFLYKTFVEAILKSKNCYEFFKGYDVIIPVPLHFKRKMIRGYNQSELIAKEISKYFKNLKYETKVMKKVKNTKPQSSLRKIERLTNLKNAYEIKNFERIKNKKILLIDDIYTTGSTLTECSKALKNAGVKEIGVITIAKTNHE